MDGFIKVNVVDQDMPGDNVFYVKVEFAGGYIDYEGPFTYTLSELDSWAFNGFVASEKKYIPFRRSYYMDANSNVFQKVSKSIKDIQVEDEASHISISFNRNQH